MRVAERQGAAATTQHWKLASRWFRSLTAWRALVISCAALSLWLAYAWCPGQLGTFDSAFYVDGARHLAAGDGYVSAATEPDSSAYAPITRWAPGLSALTALLMLACHLSALKASAFALGIAYVVLILGTLWLSSLLMGSGKRLLCVLCTLLIACNRQVLTALDVLLSDLLFGALAILSTAVAVKLARSPRWPWLAVIGFAGLLTALFAVRYAGALYLPGLIVATALAMHMRHHPLRRTLWNLGRVVLLVGALISLWIVRNLQYGELPLGERIAIHDDWRKHAIRALHGIFPWWFSLQELARRRELQASLTWLTVIMAVIVVVLLVQRSTRSWECVLFLFLPSAAYAVLMIAAASHVKFDAIQNPRFWVPLWPLTGLAIACAAAHAKTPLRRVLSGALVAALVLGAWNELTWLRGGLRHADHPSGLLSPAWRAAAEALPPPATCSLFATDLRPLMLHRRLGPASAIPLNMSDFDRAASQHASLCIATFSKKLHVSSTAERRRMEQDRVVAQLQQAGRLEQLSSQAGVTVYRLRR